jgi:hypothetical protein
VTILVDVVGLKDLAHATLTDLGNDPVVAELGTFSKNGTPLSVRRLSTGPGR